MGSHLERFLRWDNLRFCVWTAGHSQEKGNRHRHEDFLELVFVHTGTAIHEWRGRELPIHPGHIFLIPECCEHRYRNAREMEIYNILFTRDFLDYISSDLRGLPNYQLLFNLEGMTDAPLLELEADRFPDVVGILEEIIAEQKADLPGGRMAVLAGLLRVFLFFFRHARPVGGATPDSAGSHASRISRLLAALDQRYREPWSLDKMAAFVHMSTVNFRQEFKRLTGFSPVDYLLNTRLEKASHLLQLPGRTIAEIAELAGFSDSNYFARQFRRRYAVTPSGYRRLSGPHRN